MRANADTPDTTPAGRCASAPDGADSLGLSPWQYDKVAAFMDAAGRHLPRHYRPDCCIAATAIACDVLGGLHMRIAPLVVQVDILNPPLAALGRCAEDQDEYERLVRESGAWWITLGWREATGGTGWPGHLVALACGGCVLDPTLPQASRPGKGIMLPPLAFAVSADFIAGREPRVLEVNGCLLRYEAFPDDRSFTRSKDWQDPRRRGPAVKAIRDEVHARLRGR
jgi:hypothetical protein